MKNLGRILLVVLALFAITHLISCGGGSSNGTSSTIIGAEGGEITSADGRLTITIPAGALTEDTEISITKISVNELGAEFAVISAQRAYQLAPDGLTFIIPATAAYDDRNGPVIENGDFEAELPLLFSSGAGALQLLPNQSLSTDLDTGSVTLKGDLLHFSPLVLSSNNGITMTVSGVPSSMAVNGSFLAAVTITNQISAEGFTQYGLLEGRYLDYSILPIKATFQSEQTSFISAPIPLVAPNLAQSIFPYTCTAVGGGTYVSAVVAFLQAPVDYLSWFEPRSDGIFGFALDFKKGITCTAPGAPQPTATPPGTPPETTPDPMNDKPCLEAGLYSSAAPGCGISNFRVQTVTGEGNVVVDRFGDNQGSYSFNKTSNPKKFQSARTDLIIFKKPGHTCTLECGPGADQVTLTCTDGASVCSEELSLQR